LGSSTQTDGCPPLAPLPARDRDGHKGTFGTVVVVGGCAMGLGTHPHAGDAGARVMFGGPVLCARAALRSGCGLVDLALPAPLVPGALVALESATAHALPVDASGELDASGCAAVLDPVLSRASALAIGPGLGGGHAVAQLVVRLLAREALPTVVDADAAALGLSALAEGAASAELHRAAQALAQRVGAVVILKGSQTTVSDGMHAWSIRAGSPALATGGSGDALAGICASLVAQFGPASRARSLSMLDCARWAVIVHGMAALRWSAAHGQAGMLAQELCDSVPEALEEARQHALHG
jgi:NAD(P)H-hydrate epimerase